MPHNPSAQFVELTFAFDVPPMLSQVIDEAQGVKAGDPCVLCHGDILAKTVLKSSHQWGVLLASAVGCLTQWTNQEC